MCRNRRKISIVQRINFEFVEELFEKIRNNLHTTEDNVTFDSLQIENERNKRSNFQFRIDRQTIEITEMKIRLEDHIFQLEFD